MGGVAGAVAPAPGPGRGVLAAALAGTLLLVGLVHLPVLGYDFTNWDDPVYVLRNPDIKNLGWEGAGKLFTGFVSGNYQPLTMLAHALEYRLFGLDPRGYHAVNLLLHLLTTGMVFALVRSWTGGRLVAAVAGALFFGVHPMRAETVAWVADLKDGLAAALLAGALLAYGSYQRRGGAGRYGASLLLFALGLLAKGTSLLFPGILLLCDALSRRRIDARVLGEKLPFAAVSAASAALNLAARADYQDILREAAQPWAAAVSLQVQRLAGYFLLRVVAPWNDGLLDPEATRQLPLGSPSSLAALAALALLAAVVALSLRRTRTLAFAALFFLLAIAPVFKARVLGFTADRFAYFPAIGLSLPAGAAVEALLRWAASRSRALLAAASLALCALLGLAAWQARAALPTWSDSVALWSEAVSRYPARTGSLALYRAEAHIERGDPAAALRDAGRAIAEAPGFGFAWQVLGRAQRAAGDLEEAARSLDRALMLDATLPASYNARGEVHLDRGNPGAARSFFSAALRLDARYPEALANRGRARALLGDHAGGAEDVARALALDPDCGEAVLARGTLRLIGGDVAGAREDFRLAVSLKPALAASVPLPDRRAVPGGRRGASGAGTGP